MGSRYALLATFSAAIFQFAPGVVERVPIRLRDSSASFRTAESFIIRDRDTENYRFRAHDVWDGTLLDISSENGQRLSSLGSGVNYGQFRETGRVRAECPASILPGACTSFV